MTTKNDNLPNPETGTKGGDISDSSSSACSTLVGSDFYQGMEWLGAWLIDHAEGEIVTEELAREWAAKAWLEHLINS